MLCFGRHFVCFKVLFWLFVGGINHCKADLFQCRDGSCIPSIFHCDGMHNCADGSDETSCMPGMCADSSLDAVVCLSLCLCFHQNL